MQQLINASLPKSMSVDKHALRAQHLPNPLLKKNP